MEKWEGYRDQVKYCYAEKMDTLLQKKKFCSNMRSLKWDDKSAFELNPNEFMGGAAERYAEKRKERLNTVRNKLWARLIIEYGSVDLEDWAKKVTFDKAGIEDI